MTPLVIDTNALVSFVTDRNPGQQKKIAALLEKAARSETLVLCPQNVLTEFVYVMERIYRVEKGRISSMIADFMDLPGVEVVDKLDYARLLALWPSRIAEYGDAVVAAVCQAHKGSSVVTFDRKLIASLRASNVATTAL